MITRVSGVIRPEGLRVIFDHPYNAEYLLVPPRGRARVPTRRTASYGHQVVCGLQGYMFTLPECSSPSGIVRSWPTFRSAL
jgi:hypothetical protein